MTCINNPRFIEYLEKKVSLALKEGVDGIFLDNLFFGIFPITMGNKVSFFGCNCRHCQTKFKTEYGMNIPKLFDTNSELFSCYQDFRTRSMSNFISHFSEIVTKNNKKFGFNNLDPKLNSKLAYGLDFESYANKVDYFLFEKYYENKIIRKIGDWAYYKAIK